MIKTVVKTLKKSKAFGKLEGHGGFFCRHLISGVLYVVLTVAVIGILGVPMASVITVLASAGVAVGLALQGALSNLAGGIMHDDLQALPCGRLCGGLRRRGRWWRK